MCGPSGSCRILWDGWCGGERAAGACGWRAQPSVIERAGEGRGEGKMYGTGTVGRGHAASHRTAWHAPPCINLSAYPASSSPASSSPSSVLPLHRWQSRVQPEGTPVRPKREELPRRHTLLPTDYINSRVSLSPRSLPSSLSGRHMASEDRELHFSKRSPCPARRVRQGRKASAQP